MDHLGYVAMIIIQVIVMMVSSVLSQANNSQGISICIYSNAPILLLYCTSPTIILTFTVPNISVCIDSDGIL